MVMRIVSVLLLTLSIAYAGNCNAASGAGASDGAGALDKWAILSARGVVADVQGVVVDEQGKGVAGVVVSDGFGVYKSGADGRFAFKPAERAKFVFISTPDGYEQVGSFSYKIGGKNVSDKIGDNEQKNGDRGLIFRLKKSLSNGPAAQQDSPATRQDSPATRTEFLHLGDTEARIHKDWVDVLKEYVVYNRPAFVLFNGDICYENGLRFHARELTTENLGVRAVYSLGNHDLVDGTYGEELYEELFGPVWYSFNCGGVHFVNIPVLQGDRKPSYSADDVYTWLKRDLDAIPAGMPVVLIDHHLVGYADDFLLRGERVSVNLLDYNFKAYLYAHYHTNLLEKSDKTGVTTIATMSPNKGGIDHTPSSFRSIKFDREGNLDSQIRYASLKGHIAATIFPAKNSDSRASNSDFRLVVNVYDTRSDVTEVKVKFNGTDYHLHKMSEWTWMGLLPSPVEKQSATETAIVTTTFENGMIVKAIARNPSDIGAFSPRNGDRYSPQIKWATSLGNHVFMTSPVLYGDLVLSATFDDNGKGGSAIHGLRRSDGEVVWRLPVKSAIKNNMAIWEGTLVACDVMGQLYAIEASTGKLLWTKALREKELHPGYTQGVTVHNGVVYAGHGHYLTAVRVSDGRVMWKNTAWRGGVCTVASPVVEPESGVLLTAAYWTGRFAHNAASGELLWSKKDDDTRIADNSPVFYKGRFFYASPGYIMEVDPLSGTELVKHKINYTINNNSRPVVTDKLFIIGTTDKGVVAFDRENDYKELWNFKTNPGIIYTAPYTKDFQMTVEGGALLHRDSLGEVLYFGANDGYLYSIDAVTGVFRWRINLGAPVLGNVVMEDGVLYVSDFAGNMWAIKIQN